VIGAGVRQIVDLGAGLPTQGNTHEIAPEAKVVYVDYDPVVCAHGRALLTTGESVDSVHSVHIVQADVREPDELLDVLGGLVDFGRPVAFLMLAVLHFIPDGEAYDIVGRLRDAGPAGSHLVLSHAIDTQLDATPEAVEIYQRATAALSLRNRDQIARFFDGYELAEPGLVLPHEWRPGTEPLPGDTSPPIGYAGVGRKL
jgi:O-methyltransferase involved in polyketide biosynthesis